jgi:hypothetical protein
MLFIADENLRAFTLQQLCNRNAAPAGADDTDFSVSKL